jgi:hypothetical protein
MNIDGRYVVPPGAVYAFDGPALDCPARQVRDVLASAGSAMAACGPGRHDGAPNAGPGDLLVQLGRQFVQVAGVVSGGGGVVAVFLGVGSEPDPPLPTTRAAAPACPPPPP